MTSTMLTNLDLAILAVMRSMEDKTAGEIALLRIVDKLEDQIRSIKTLERNASGSQAKR